MVQRYDNPPKLLLHNLRGNLPDFPFRTEKAADTPSVGISAALQIEFLQTFRPSVYLGYKSLYSLAASKQGQALLLKVLWPTITALGCCFSVLSADSASILFGLWFECLLDFHLHQVHPRSRCPVSGDCGSDSGHQSFRRVCLSRWYHLYELHNDSHIRLTILFPDATR